MKPHGLARGVGVGLFLFVLLPLVAGPVTDPKSPQSSRPAHTQGQKHTLPGQKPLTPQQQKVLSQQGKKQIPLSQQKIKPPLGGATKQQQPIAGQKKQHVIPKQQPIKKPVPAGTKQQSKLQQKPQQKIPAKTKQGQGRSDVKVKIKIVPQPPPKPVVLEAQYVKRNQTFPEFTPHTAALSCSAIGGYFCPEGSTCCVTSPGGMTPSTTSSEWKCCPLQHVSHVITMSCDLSSHVT